MILSGQCEAHRPATADLAHLLRGFYEERENN
jgi:hypothetical protein